MSFVLSAATLSAMPQGAEVVHGSAEFEVSKPSCLTVKVSDRTIVNYQSFGIGLGERVCFVQPHSEATVLNRIVGQDPSQIFGSLEANGRVFLVNPNGVYFGPKATVNVGSLVVSTLDIRDKDFIRGNYVFETGSQNGSIVNDGSLSAEQNIALIAPVIQNYGSIFARADKVITAAGEKVTLDFSGDGLLQFSVDGKLEQALLENYGSIEAAGAVKLSMRAAHRAIQTVVNTDGLEVASAVEVENGVVRLVASSVTKAKFVEIDGPKTVVQGEVVGETVHVLGHEVELRGAEIDVSGDVGGGTVLVGGDYQGKGSVKNARFTTVDEETIILADARIKGDGGKVIVWADDTIVFEGKIAVRGGPISGNGGFVETSGENGSPNGWVDTSAPNGKFGTWLMDPSSITIIRNNTNQGASALNTAATCSGGGFNINDTTINNAASNVVLCTAGTITYNNGAIVNITTAGVGLQHGAASNPSNITFQTGANTTWPITTNGGAIAFNGPVTIPANDTLNISTSGGNVSFASTLNGTTNTGTLTVAAGTGTVSFTGIVGGTASLTNIAFTSSGGISVGNNITVNGTNTLNFAQAVTLTGTSTITSNNAAITFTSTLNGTAAGSQALTLAGGSGQITFTGIVGGTTRLGAISATTTNATGVSIGNNITANSLTLTATTNATLAGTSTINTSANNGNVSIGGTVNGAQALTITGGGGITTFTGAVGGTAALSSLSVTSATVTQTSTAKTTGALTYAGSTAINLGGNVTTNGGVVTMTGPVTLNATSVIDTTNAGGTPAGAAISFSSNITGGANSLTLNAGTGGTASIGGNLSTNAFTVTNSGSTTVTGTTVVPTVTLTNTTGNITFTGAVTISTTFSINGLAYGVVISNGGTITPATTFSNTGGVTLQSGSSANLTFTNGFTSTASTTTILGTIKATTAAAGVTLGATTFSAGTSSLTTNGGAVSAGALSVAGATVTVDATNGGGTPAGAGITLTTVNGAGNVTVTGGTGATVSFGAVGGTTALTTWTVSGGTVTQSSTAKTTGAISYTGTTLINLGGNVTTSGGTVGMTGAVALTAGVTVDTTNSNGTPAGAGITFSSTINNGQTLSLNGGTGGTVSMNGAVGGTALTSLTATGATVTQGSTAKTTGAISYTGTTAINVGGNVTTSGGVVTMTGPVTVTGTSIVDTTNAGGTPAGAAISFTNNVSGANNLTVNSGTGNTTTVSGNLSTNAFTVTQSAGTTITGTTTVPTVTLTNTTGAITFNGAATVSTTFSTAAQGYSVVFNNGGTITPATTFSNTGGVTLKSGGSASLSFTNGFTSTASTTTVLGTVKATASAAAVSLAATTFSSGTSSVITNGGTIGISGTTTLTGNATLDSTNSGGTPAGATITLSTVNGPGNLTLISGTSGSQNLNGVIGGGTAVGVLTISSANSVTATTITAGSIVQSAGSGTTTFNGVVLTTGASGISLTGTNFAINANMTTQAGSGGPISITHSGTLVIAPTATISADGGFTDNGTGSATTNLSGTINTNGQNLSFAKPVSVVGTASLNTGSGVGNIVFSSTLDGNNNLTLAAGGGNITFTGAVGGTTPLNTLTISSANNVTANAMSVATLVQSAGTGTTAFNGALSVSSASGISLTGHNVTFNNTVTTAAGGPTGVSVSGTLVLTSSAALNLSGAFSQTGTGSVQSAGSITTASTNISFAGPVTLSSGTTTLSTGGGNILFSSTVDGPGALTLTAGTGNITITGAAGGATRVGVLTINAATNVTTAAITAGSINQAVASTGTANFGGDLNTNAVAGVVLQGAAVTINGNLTTTNGGPFSVTNSGTLNLTAGAASLLSSTFTQSGGGGVNLSGTIVTTGSGISFANAVSLTGTTALSTGAATGNIVFSSTVDGTQNLDLTAGGGNITFTGAVGTTRLSALTIHSANNVTANAISAASITELSGTGTTTFNGALNTNAVGGIALTGTTFTINNTVTTTMAGPLSINNSSTLTVNSTCTIAGAFTQTNAGTIALTSGTVSAAGISTQSAMTVSGTSSLTSTGAGNDMTLSGTIDGGGNLTLSSGRNITLASAVGSTTRVGAFVVSGGVNVTTVGITAASINITSSGLLSITGDLNTNGVSGMTFTVNNFTRTGNITTTSGGPEIVTNSGTFTTTSTGTRSIDGYFVQSGGGTTVISGTVTANNSLSAMSDAVHFTNAITLNGDVTLSAPVNGNITVAGTVNGAHAFNLSSAHNTNINGIVGGTTPPTAVNFTTAVNVTTTAAITAGTITQSAGTGTSTFVALTTSGASGIVLTGSAFTFGGAVTTAASGPFTLTNSGTAQFNSPLTIDGIFTQTGAGAVSLGANITTDNENITFASAVTLTADAALNSGTGAGAITLSSTLDGGHVFSASAGTDNANFSGVIGGITPLTSLTLTGNNINLVNIGGASAGVSGLTSLSATTNLNFNGSIYNMNTQSITGNPVNITTVPLTTFTTNGNNITFAGTQMLLGSNANVTVNSTGGNITLSPLDAGMSSLRTVTLNAGTGTITVVNMGTSGNGELASVALTGGNIQIRGNVFTNALTFTPTGQIFLGGDITTTTALVFPVAVVRDTVSTATVTTGGTNLTFSSTIDSDTTPRNLTLASGAGDISVVGAIGATHPLSSLTISTAHSATFAAVSAGFIAQSAGTGTTTFGGQVTTTAVQGVNLTGTGFSFTNGVTTTTGSGLVTINNAGTLSISTGTVWHVGGAFTQTAAHPVQLAVEIDGSDMISFAGPVTLTAATILDTTANNQSITLSNTVNGPGAFTLKAGTGNIFLQAAAGGSTRLGAVVVTSASNITIVSMSASSMNLTWSTGAFTYAGALNTNAIGGIVLTGTNIVSNGGSITTTGLGPLNVTTTGTTSGTPGGPTIVSGSIIQNSTGTGFLGGLFKSLTGSITTNHNVTLVAPLIVDTSTGNGIIDIKGTVDGAFPLTFTSGSGSITLEQAIGSTVPVAAFTISTAGTVSTQAISAASITQTTGTGTTTFNGALTTTGSSGISVHANSIVRGAAITTTGSGPVTIAIANAGTFTSTAAGAINIDGAFAQTGTGAVSFGGSIVTTNDPISFAGPVTLAADSSFNTGASGVGSITFSSTVQGAHALTLSSGTDDIFLNGAVGTMVTPLGAITISTARNVTAQAITAASISQAVGTGTTDFQGAVSTTGASGISLIGSGFTIENTMTTAAGGSLTVTNSGTWTLTSGANVSIAGSIIENGSGGVSLSGTMATTGTGTISFTEPVTTTGTASLTTVNQSITFQDTVDGPGSLTLNSGSDDIAFQRDAGGLTALNVLTITAARNVTTDAVTAASIVQSAGSGTSSFTGDVTATGAAGINLTGTTFTFSGNVTTALSSGGQIQINNSGVLTTAVTKTVSGDGGVSQTNTGAVHLGGNVSANNSAISFAGAITLFGNVIMNSRSAGTGGGDVTVTTVDGGFDLTFTCGTTGSITASGAIGGLTRLGTLKATSCLNITAHSQTAGSIVQLAGAGLTTLNGSINTNTPAGISLTGTNFFRAGSIITTNGGSFVVTNSGMITGSGINTTSIDGSYTQNGTGTTFLVGTISARQGISFSGPIVLALADTILDTSGGNGNITITNTIDNYIDGPHQLTLNSGSGSVSLSGAVGGSNPIGNLIFGNVNNITTAAVSSASISQTGTLTGLATFNGAISTSGASGIVLSGAGFTFNNNITTASSGPMTITNTGTLTLASGIVASIGGAFTQSGAGTISSGASISTTNGNITTASQMTLIGNASFNSGAGTGNVSIGTSVDGAFGLTLSGGAGTVSIPRIGLTTPPTALTMNSGASFTAGSSVAVAGPVSITSAGAVLWSSTLTTTGGSGTIAVSNGGTLTITSAVNSSQSFVQSGAGGNSVNANITTAGTLQFGSNVTLTSNVSFNSGGGAITLSGTVDSDTTPRNWTLTAGGGSIAFSSAIGGTNPISALQIVSANNVTSSHDIAAASILQSAGSGLTHFTGKLSTTGLSGISLTGNQFMLDDKINTTGSGPLTIVHTGTLTMNTPSATHSLTGAFSESGGGGVTTSANLTASNQPITFADAVTLASDVTYISSGLGQNITFSSTISGAHCLTLTTGAGTIELDGTVNIGCLTASGNTVFQNTSVTTTGAVQETGVIQLVGNITTSANDITLTGNVSVQTANVTLSTSGGTGTIHVTGTLNGNVSGRNFSALTGSGGTVTFDSPVGGAAPFHNFTVTTGTLNINNFGSTSSGANGTAAFTASSNINFSGTTYINATQNYTAGTNFNFNAGALTTITSNGNPIVFATGTSQLSGGNDLTINSNGGNVTLSDLLGAGRTLIINTASDTSTVTTANIGTMGQPLAAINVTAGTLNQTGTSFPTIMFSSPTVTMISANVTSPTTYDSPVQITADNVAFSGGAFIFNSTLNSNSAGAARNITFNLGGSALTFNAPVGTTTPLSSITVNNATDVAVGSAMTVGAFVQNSGTGTTTFSGGLSTVTTAGTGSTGNMSVTGTNITLSGGYSIAGGVTLNNSGTLLTPSGASIDVVSSAFQQTGAGGATFSGNVQTADQEILFHGPVTMNGDLTLNSVGTTGGLIQFDNTIDGGHNLSLTAGTGNVTLTGAIGGGTRVTSVDIASGGTVSTGAITAGSITQQAGTTSTSFGALNTNTLTGISLTGNAFTQNGSITTTAVGSFTIHNSGTFTTGGNSATVGGSYVQSGSGSVNLAGTITAQQGASFAGTVTLFGGNTTIDTTGANGNITVSSTINNDVVTPRTLTLKSGTGNVTLSSAIGGTQPIGPLIFGNTNNVTAGAISADSIQKVAATSIAGTGTFNGAISTTGASGIVLNGNQFAINNNVTTATGGVLTITNTGPLTMAGTTYSLDGAFTQSGGGAVSYAGSMTTTADAILFTNAVMLTGASSFATGAGANITFTSTVDGGQNLDLTAGTGAISFGAAVGSSQGIGTLTIHSAAGITYPAVTATGISQLAGSGTTTISGALHTSTATGISLIGSVFAQNGTVTTTSTGVYTVRHSGAYTMAANISADGGFTDSALSTGTFALNGTVQTNNAPIAFNGSGAITLAGTTMLNSGAGGGDITVASTIDGANDLTLLAGTGSVTFNANIGVATARIGALTIATGSNVTAQQIRAASLTQNTATMTNGISDFKGAINTTGAVSLTGQAFTIESTVVTGAGNSVTMDNNGLFTLTGSISPGSGGSFNQTGTGTSSISGTITVAGAGSISYQGPVTVPSSQTATHVTANQAINFRNTVDGPGSVTLTAGTADITFSEDAGLGTALNAVLINTARNVTTEAVTAASITQSAGTGTTNFMSDVNATGVVNLTGAAFTFTGNATAGGNVSVANSGVLTLSPNKTVASSGNFAQTDVGGTGTVSLGGTIATHSGTIGVADPITLTGTAILNSAVSGTGGAITVPTIDGGFNLTFSAGTTGAVTAGAIGGGTPVLDVVFTNNNGTTLTSIAGRSITQTTGTGTFSFTGAFNTTGSSGIHLTVQNLSRNGNVITAAGSSGDYAINNSGTVTVAGGTSTSIDGSYIQTGTGPGATVSFGGNVTARLGITFTSPITVTGNIALDTSGGNGNISVGNTVDGDGVSPRTFTANAGAGNVTLSQPVGTGTALSALTATGTNVTLANVGTSGAAGVTGAITVPSGPDAVVFTGTMYNSGAQTYTANQTFNINGGALTTLKSNGAAVQFNTGTVLLAASTDLTINSGGGAVTTTTSPIHAGANSGQTLTINAGTATVTTGTIGTSANGEFALASLTGTLVLLGDIVADAVSLVPTGTINVSGNITTTNTTLTLPNAVKLNASRTFSTGSGLGDIVFSSTLNGDTDNTRTMTLLAGTGSITLGAVGGTHPLNLLVISSAKDVTAGAISSSGLIQTAGTGTSTFGGAITTTGAGGVSLTGSSFTTNAVSTSGSPVVVNQTGTLTVAGAVTSGSFSQNGAGSTSFSGSITASNAVAFAGVVNLSGTPSIDTSAANQSITFSNFLQGPGAFTLASGGGDISLVKAAGSTTPLGAVTVTTSHNITIQNFTATSLNLMASSGTASISGALTTSGGSGITLVGTNFIRNGAIITTGGGSITVTNSGLVTGNSINTTSISGSYIQNGTGPYNLAGTITVGANISFASPITLLGPTGFDASAGGGTIGFGASSTIDGNQVLNFTAGTGAITFGAAIGANSRVGAVTISSAGGVTATTITAASIAQSAGTGTSTFNGDLNTNGTSGINLNGANFVRGANWTTTNTGPIVVTITNAGSFTSTAAGTISADGGFQQMGGGAVSISRTLNTNNAPILFSGPVTLGSGGATFNSGSGAGSITFNGTVDAAQPITLSSGAGDILFQGAVGGGTRVGVVTVSSAANATFQGLTAASFLQTAGSGTTVLNGPTNTNAIAGIHFIGNAVTLNSTVTTTAAGPVLVENDGLLTVNATCSVAGAFTQDALGSSNLSGSITSTGSTVSFAGPVTTSGSPSLTTSSQPISFASTIDGPGNLSLTAGNSGNISFGAAAGGITRLGNLQFASGNLITTGAITAASIAQSSGAGTTSLLGNLNTNGVSGINLIGSAFVINGTVVTTNTGPLTVSHSGVLTLQPGASTLIDGVFSETGTGTTSFSGTVHTNSADITFTRPITLIGNATINSDGTGDILISNTVTGNHDLVLNAGPSMIQVTAAISSINSLTIASAGNVSLQGVTAGTITQQAGTGLTTFNGSLSTTQPGGIVVAGNQFRFQAPVSTTGNGPLQITNAGTLTIDTLAAMNITGAFHQLGSGAVALSGNITSDNDAILFTGPVTLGNTVMLDTATATGDITFLNTLGGTQALTLSSGQGSVAFSRAVSGLGALSVTSANNVTASQTISATSVALSSVSGTATFDGQVSTTGSGLNWSGHAFIINGNISTANGGTFTLTNTGNVSLVSGVAIALDGAFLQNGTGLVNANGTWTTTNDNVTFGSPVLLNGNMSINTGAGIGDITFQDDVDGFFNLTLAAGTGNVVCNKAIGDGGVLKNVVMTGSNISLTGVGTISSSGSGTMSLTATQAINLANDFYSAASQTFAAGTNIHFTNGALTTMRSFGGSVVFSTGDVILSTHNDLSVNTEGGAFSFKSLAGTTFENVTVNAGRGTAILGNVPDAITINDFDITAGQIVLTDEVFAINVNLVSSGSILNIGAPLAINSTNSATFDAQGGNVGSFSSPILVNTSNQIFAGAGGPQPSLADFNGTSADNTVHALPSDPPCIIIFNGIVIQNCNFVPPGPGPVFAPVSFPTPGFNSSWYNLGNEDYFRTDFLEKKYFVQPLPIFWRALLLSPAADYTLPPAPTGTETPS